MIDRLGADLLVVLHLAFVVYVVLGGLLAVRWPRTAWLHVPAALWGVGVEWSGTVCPLTPLEVALRERGGQAGYSGGFIEHYLLPVLYPHDMTRGVQLALGFVALGVNAGIYTWLLRRRGSRPPARVRG